MFEFFKTLTDPESIIKYGGLALLLFVIFAETGLFVGFFLPGDNLVFIAGLLRNCKIHVTKPTSSTNPYVEGFPSREPPETTASS